MAKDEDKDLRKIFERFEKLLFKAANDVKTETPYSYVCEFSKRVDAATAVFKQQSKRFVDKTIPDVNFSEEVTLVLRRKGAFHETANVKLTTYIQMVSQLNNSAEQFKGRIQSRIDQDEKSGITTTVTDLREYIKDELRSGHGLIIEYKNGAKMPVDKYAAMLAQTTRIETHNIAMVGKALNDGNDLVECSTIYPTCPTCARLQGRIYSISGNTPGYPSLYDTAFKHGYSIIHPNCRHQWFPYNPKFHTAEENERLQRDTRRPWDDDNAGGIDEKQRKAYREQYAKSQMQMRQWNKELNTYAEYKKQCYQLEEAPRYSTLGSFRRAYRSEEGSTAYARTHYFIRDAKQFEEFKEVLGAENMPETVDKFQEIKYNKSAEFEDKEIQVKDEKLCRKLGSTEYPLTIHADKQGKHIRSAKTFDETKKKSYLAVDSVEEGLKLSQDIVDEYHGKGTFDRTLEGDWKSTEYIITDKIIGYVLDKDNKWTPTKYAVIHYSKTGTHIVPTLRKKK